MPKNCIIMISFAIVAQGQFLKEAVIRANSTYGHLNKILNLDLWEHFPKDSTGRNSNIL
jgi:hypothetical protein